MSIHTIAFHNYYEELNRDNRLFEARNAAIGDDLLLPLIELRTWARLQGIQVATVPMLAPDDIDAYVFIDMPDPDNRAFNAARSSGKPLYLIVMESPLVRPQNYDPSSLCIFRRVFTYNDDYVDGNRFIKLNYSVNLSVNFPITRDGKEKLCVMIAGKKQSRHPQELYEERMNAIRWFEENHPYDFDLYGIGWDLGTIGQKLPARIIHRLPWLGRLGADHFPSYRGPVVRKRDVMGRYRFALCYENIRDVPGYITEKIFDAFLNGTVPVYRGANNVSDHIPTDCFIDFREFPNYEMLYLFLKNMSDDVYTGYLRNIKRYLASGDSYPFSTEYFAKTIIRGIVGE